VGGSPWIIGPITADGPYFCDPCAALELLAAGSVWIDLEPPPCVVLEWPGVMEPEELLPLLLPPVFEAMAVATRAGIS